MLLAILAAAGISLAPPPARADSLDAIKHVDYLISQYYRPEASRTPRWMGVRTYDQSFTDRCDGDMGDVCYAGDPDAGPCPPYVQCHHDPDHMIDVMLQATKDYPASGYLAGQTVYTLVKAHRLPEALKVAEACTAATWWCEALQGYVLHFQAKDTEADSVFRVALRAAPDSVACAWNDATWLLGSWDQRGSTLSTVPARDAVSSWGCRRRTAVSDSIWWLSDPLYSVRGNSRWVEHLARYMETRFSDEIRRAERLPEASPEARENRWASRIRRGALDSWDSRRGERWTSRAGARYHFVPDVTADELAHPTWRLEGHIDDEGYTTPFEPIVPLLHQIARFRGGDSLRVAVAAQLRGTRVARALDATATFVLGGGPHRRPVMLTGDAHQPTVRFLGSAAPRRYVTSLEVVTSKGVGWDRRTLEPLSTDGPDVSDLLLYATPDSGEPSTLAQAAGLMQGTTTVSRGAGIGVYWETYGAPAPTVLELDLSVERRSGGLVDRLRGLLPGGDREGHGRITWTEPASGTMHASAVSLDLRDLDSGDYTLVLHVGWDGRPMLERRRDITVK